MIFDPFTNCGNTTTAKPTLRPVLTNPAHRLGVNTHEMTRRQADLARGEIARMMRARPASK